MPEGSLVHYELMSEHYVTLSFSTDEAVHLQLGDYVDIDGFGRFELTEPYSPKYNHATDGYDYSLRLDAYYIKWKNKVVRYMPAAAASETSFHLTAIASVHLAVIVNGINELGQKDPNFLYGGSTDFRYELRNFPADKVNAAKYKQYNNTDFISALNDLATIFECEWWVETNTIFFGKCSLGNEPGDFVDFALNGNVSEMRSSENKGDFATRIIAFGSTRNLPSEYRKNQSADITQNGVVQKRLMLPLALCPNGYIQNADVDSETGAVEMVVVNDDIYPRVLCNISEVNTYTDTTTDPETGETVTQTFYRLKTDTEFSFSSDYILEGQTLHILFQSGRMNGMDFECMYNDEHSYYEVVVNEDYGRQLPDVDLHPEVGDKFVIYGWDATKISSTGIIDAAEQELYNYVSVRLQNMQVDKNTYTCLMNPVEYEAKMVAEGTFKHYDVGQAVTLINPTFSSNRESRIIGYEIKLDIIYDFPQYIVGEFTKYSKTADLQGQIDSIVVNGVSYEKNASGGGGVYIITTTSSVPPTDSNVYSAKRIDRDYMRKDEADERFLRKDQDDTTPYKLTMGEGLVKRGLNTGNGTSSGDLTVEGDLDVDLDSTLRGMTTVGNNANLNPVGEDSLTFNVKGKSTMRTVVFGDYAPGLITGAAQGAMITKEGYASFRGVQIGESLEVPEIRFNRATVSIGIGLRSEGGGIVELVEPDLDSQGNELSSGWVRLKLEDGEYGAVEMGDLLLGFWHNEVLDNYGHKNVEATIASNADANYDPRNGDYELKGFQSVYFKIDALGVLYADDEESEDTSTGRLYLRHQFADEDSVKGNQNNSRFHYRLRGTEHSHSTTVKNFNKHPHDGMHFGCIGNCATYTNPETHVSEYRYPERQKLAVTTPSYELMLENLFDWNYNSNNIKKIEGDLTGFSMSVVDDDGSVYTKSFSGTGIVLGNAYIFGKLDQFERVGYRGIIHQSRGGFISPNMTEIETMTIVNGYGEDVTSRFTNFWVTRDSGDSESDTIWNNTRGHQCGGAGREDNTFEILFSDLRYVEGGVMGSRLFIFNASDITGQSRASVAMEFTT